MACRRSINEYVIRLMFDIIQHHHFDVLCVILIYLRSMRRGRCASRTACRSPTSISEGFQNRLDTLTDL
ncbi:hypothetical protein AAHA92_30901 [Salvia divinorum]|uniref:Uncharacterized protein n=1 Tax=Salvia divinorum TaxID=28513 RepID=A0ABD1FSF5_SALDI